MTQQFASARPVNFGSAHLLVDGTDHTRAHELLEAAVAAGVRLFDTAPLYGHGGSEILVASAVARHPEVAVTTKVGLEPSPAPGRARVLVGATFRMLPPFLRNGVERLRGRGAVAVPTHMGVSGRFDLPVVQSSIERSLSRLGRVNRLLLHEVHPADITAELLTLLDGYRRRGDVVSLGVATANHVTAEALSRGGPMFSVAHFSVDPLGAPLPDLTAAPTCTRIGHGALGPAGSTLARLREAMSHDPQLALRWQHAVEGTSFTVEPQGLALALLAHAAEALDELLIATRRPCRVSGSVAAASGRQRLPLPARRLLTGWFRVARSAGAFAPPHG